MVKFTAFIFLFFAGGFLAFGQSNAMIDTLLEEQQATWGPASYLVLTAAGLVQEEISAPDAVKSVADKGWFKKAGAPEEQIKLGEFSHMLMKAFGVKGGVMYSLIPGPRYASRELFFKKIIRKHSSPYRALSGEEAVDILRMLLEWKEVRS